MFVRKKTLYGGKIAVQICENYREQGRVRRRVLKHVGTAERKDLETLAKLIETSAFIKKELEDQKENWLGGIYEEISDKSGLPICDNERGNSKIKIDEEKVAEAAKWNR